MNMHWHTAIATHTGGRSEQQDRVAVISRSGKKALLIVIADGMGGHRNGAEAAQIVIDTGNTVFGEMPESDPLACLSEIITQSHDAIKKLDNRTDRAPGSTCAMLYLTGSKAYWAHVGDSRIYHFRKFNLLERTSDHSVAQLLVAEGELAESQQACSPHQSQLFMCLGGAKTPTPDYDCSELREDDAFVVCSDGFWGSVHPEDVVNLLFRPPLVESVNFFVQLAAERGGSKGDNIAAALVRIEKQTKLELPVWLTNTVLSVKQTLASVKARSV